MRYSAAGAASDRRGPRLPSSLPSSFSDSCAATQRPAGSLTKRRDHAVAPARCRERRRNGLRFL